MRNGTVIGAGVIATVGRVVRNDQKFRIDVASDRRHRLEESFRPVRPPLRTLGDLEHHGPHWRLPGSAYRELFVNRGGETPTMTYRGGGFETDKRLPDDAPEFTPGRGVWLQHENNAGHLFFLDNRHGDGLFDVSLIDLRLVNVPGMAIAGSVRRGLLIDRVRTEPSADEPFAVASDTVHLNATAGDVVIQHCDFGPSLDDKVNIKGNWWRVDTVDRDASRCVVVPAGRKTSVRRWGSRNDRVIAIDGRRSVVARTELAGDAVRVGGRRHRLSLVTLPAEIGPGTLLANATTSGARIVIRDNVFRDTRAQGVLIQTSHVSVTGNHFIGIAGPAVDVRFVHDGWFESIAPRNVRVADNRYERCGVATDKPDGPVEVSQRDSEGGSVDVIQSLRTD